MLENFKIFLGFDLQQRITPEYLTNVLNLRLITNFVIFFSFILLQKNYNDTINYVGELLIICYTYVIKIELTNNRVPKKFE